MPGTENLSINELINCIVKVNQRVAGNYLRNFSGYHHDMCDITSTYSDFMNKLLVSPVEIGKVIKFNLDFFKAQQDIWINTFSNSNGGSATVIEPQKGDKRFSDEEWHKNPFFNFIQQNYLLAERLSQQIIDEVEVDDKIRRKLDFYVEQYMSAFSPSNFLFTNPEVLKLAFETKGKNLWDGLNNLVKDLEKGKITQTDESAYEVGKNIATMPGTVIYENELIQLIQYTPITKNVFEMPLLIIPPWINKYYILDLQPKNSFVKFLVEQGISVFMISWRNPKPGMGYLKLDDYVEKGALKAIEVAKNISGAKKINTLGYCLGGTLLSISGSILSMRQPKENPVNSATFLATMVDFSDIGPMGDVVDKALINKLERGELLNDGLLNGSDMETGFNLVQSKNLVWNYVINNYLKGIKPSAFDVMYWTNDNTNLPAAMYIYYMRYIILENKLSTKNALTICNTSIDIGKINFPVIIISLKEDIISPAKTGFMTTQLVKGPVEFILGESGHVMGVVNPPSKKKYGHYLNGTLGKGFEEWRKTAEYVEGTWWITWSEKLKKLSGKEISSSLKAGNKEYKGIERAPGRFVKEKC
jgi:polyhydroxyalkanoate synthase